MLSPLKETVEVACPKCGHVQPEPRTAYSTFCKQCQEHYLVQEKLRPQPAMPKPEVERRLVTCFQCGTELQVSKAASSTMCKRCSSHVDLCDYQVTHTVSKSFRTHGRLVIEEKGYVLNTDARVGEAIVKGRLIGKLVVERRLEIHSSATIKGTFTAGELVIPAGQHLRWPEPLQVGGADLLGELVGTIVATGTVRLRSGARFFGDVRSAHLVVEPSAVFVGSADVGRRHEALLKA